MTPDPQPRSTRRKSWGVALLLLLGLGLPSACVGCRVLVRPYENAAKQLQFSVRSVNVGKGEGLIPTSLSLSAEVEIRNPSEWDLEVSDHEVALEMVAKEGAEAVKLGQLNLPDAVKIPKGSAVSVPVQWKLSLRDAKPLMQAALGTLKDQGVRFSLEGRAQGRVYGLKVPIHYRIAREGVKLSL